MHRRHFFSELALLLLLLVTACYSEDYSEREPSDWLYFGIRSDEPIHFSRIYVPDGPVVYRDTTYDYRAVDSRYGPLPHTSLKLPLSLYTDSLVYVFEQENRQDTLIVTYKQGTRFASKEEGMLYLFTDHRIAYTTFENVILCMSCYGLR